MHEIKYKPIGIIHSPFKESPGTPRQPSAARDTEGTIEIFPEFAQGLKDLAAFSHIILIYHFHLSRGCSLTVKPFMDGHLHGVFATRAPARPNPIGLSIVNLMKIVGKTLYIKSVDIVDGTPLLDVKPYVPAFDQQEEVKIGWLENNIRKLHGAKDDGRFVK